MPLRRLLPLILLNIMVSAAVVLAVLYWWDSRQVEESSAVTFVSVSATTEEPVESTLAATSVPEETEIPEDAPQTYRVVAGDTLGTISQQFDISVEDLMAANGLDNPNFLQIDQELNIPSNADETATGESTTAKATATESSPQIPSPIPTAVANSGEAIIEIVGIIGAGTLENERIVIANTGTLPVSLRDWRIVSENGDEYTFGQVTLFGDGAEITLYTGQGVSGLTRLYRGLDNALFEEGDTVTLYDAEGTVRSTYTIDG